MFMFSVGWQLSQQLLNLCVLFCIPSLLSDIKRESYAEDSDSRVKFGRFG